MDDIFVKIMALIEKETDIPLLGKDILSWIGQNDKNKTAYEIYKLASQAREL